MLEQLKELDESLLLFLNGLHAPWMDPIMVFFSAKLVWIPLYLLIIGLTIYRFKKQAFLLILGIILTVASADRITSGYMKPTFERLRPCREAHLVDKVYTVKKCGGKYGFASSHAANTFGLAVFCFLLTGANRKSLGIAMLVWAGIVSYSRIYLGVHYPGDVIVGALIGTMLAILFHRIANSLNRKYLLKHVETT